MVTQKETKLHQADQKIRFLLSNEQYKRHTELMSAPVAQWPEKLKTFSDRVSRHFGDSDDVLECAIADYVRGNSYLTGVPLPN